MKTETDYRHDIIEIGKRIYAKGFVAANDGNFSVRISDDEVIITPTGMSKGYLTPDQLIKVNMSGERREGYLKPSSELPFHLKIYEIRPDVKSVVHAHPPISTAFAVAGIPLNDMILPEAIISLGCVPLAEYGTPGTDELVKTVEDTIRGCDAILMANHGALTVGPDIYTAYYKMETMEHFAYIDWIARTLGQVNQLKEEELRKLLELRKRFGADKPIYSMCPVLSALQTDEKPPVRTVPKAFGMAQSSEARSSELSRGRTVSMSEQELTELIARVTASVLKEL